jgi:putative ABC transport system permease protein
LVCAPLGGQVAAWAGSRVFESVLFGVTPTDPSIYLIVAMVLLFTSVAAARLPARHASRVDLLTAPRAE